MKTFFGNLLAIYRRELQSYFTSPFAYVIAAVFWLIGGLFLVTILLSPNGLIAQVSIADQQGISAQSYDVPYEFFENLSQPAWLASDVCAADAVDGAICRRA